jgi:hypothetical protein
MMRILKLSSLTVAVLFACLNSQQAKAQSACSPIYAPGSYQQRVDSGLFNGRVGRVRLVNNTDYSVVITLYHPDAPHQEFGFWVIEPRQSSFLDQNYYGSDWGIQLDEGEICIIGQVSNWNGSVFETQPRNLTVTSISIDNPNDLPPRDLEPEDPLPHLRRGRNLIAKGHRPQGVKALVRAQNIYREQDNTRMVNQLRAEIRKAQARR